jgi:hypothetical protein
LSHDHRIEEDVIEKMATKDRENLQQVVRWLGRTTKAHLCE